MVIEHKWSLWKSTLFNQYRFRVANELRLVQCNNLSDQLREKIKLVENDIEQLLQRIPSIDFAQIDERVNSCLTVCQKEEKRRKHEYRRVKKRCIDLRTKLVVGHAYLRARLQSEPWPTVTRTIGKKSRPNHKCRFEQQWQKGISIVYRRFQDQRDREDLSKCSEPVHNITLIPIEPLPVEPLLIDEVQEHQFLAPLPPPPLPTDVSSQEIIIPFETPPSLVSGRSPPSDRLQLTVVDDTIVKPHRFINRTLANLTQMSFHIDPDHCSSPKTNDKKKKKKLIQFLPPVPPAPQFSSTAIFDAHAFFTQSTAKTKKQKKKIDIALQPIVMANKENEKKPGRRKKVSPYDFQEEDETLTLSSTKGSKLLTDDLITARFAKNSHYQSHQSSMASTKSSRSEYRCSKREKKKKKNILGIGQTSPLKSTNNVNLSPGQLSIDDDDDDDFPSQSTLSQRRHRRTTRTTKNKSQRTRTK